MDELKELRDMINELRAKANESRFVGKEELCRRLCIGRETYYKVTDPKSDDYDPDFPKPVSLFTGQKYRFSTIDIDNYILSKSRSVAA